jgi:DNA-binding winged helix-turn-helix (wHTH) protein
LQIAWVSPANRLHSRMKPHEQATFRFGRFVLVPGERLLLCEGKPVALTGKAFDLLVTLVRHPGHLLTKDELLRAVWPGVVVEEVSLNVNVSALRKVLGAAPAGEWIETVPRQGYRFNAAVDVGDVATDARIQSSHEEPLTGPSRPKSRVPTPRRPPAPEGGHRDGWSRGGGGDRRRLAARLRPAPATRYRRSPLPFAVDGGQRLPRRRHRRRRHRGPDATARVASHPGRRHSLQGRGERPFRCRSRARGQRSRHGRLSQWRRRQAAVELVDVARNAQVWSTAYEVTLADLPKLEARVAHDLAKVLGSRLPGAQGTGPAPGPTGNMLAYQAYLQGRYLWNQRSEPSLQSAIVQFRRAIELDPGCIGPRRAGRRAHQPRLPGLCCTGRDVSCRSPVRTESAGARPVARPGTRRARLHQVLLRLGLAGAREEFTRAIELNPNDPVSHQWYAVYLLASGDADRGFREVQAAHQLDPLSLAINTDIGFHHYYSAATSKRCLSCSRFSR